MNEKQIQAAQELYDKAKTRASDIQLTPDLTEKYGKLLQKAKENLDSVKAAAKGGQEGFEDSPAQTLVKKELTSGGIFGYNPVGENTDTITIEMKHADQLSKYSERQNGFSGITKTMILTFMIISICLGSIVSTNCFIGYNWWPINMYYFIYGAVFFPIVVLYGAVYTPDWTVTFLPLLQYKSEHEPNIFKKMIKNLIGYTLLPKVEDRDESVQVTIDIWKMILRILCALSTGVFAYGIYFMKVTVIDLR